MLFVFVVPAVVAVVVVVVAAFLIHMQRLHVLKCWHFTQIYLLFFELCASNAILATATAAAAVVAVAVAVAVAAAAAAAAAVGFPLS